jgi:hypothetical protein
MIGLKTLYFDLFSGAAGDMILGALIDAGVPLDEIRGALGSLAIAPDTVWTDRVTRAGIRATRFCVRGEEDPALHAHEHPREQRDAPAHAHAAPAAGDDHGGRGGGHHADHGHAHAGGHTHTHGGGTHVHAAPPLHHPHRTLAEIAALIDRSALSQEGKARARSLFDRLGEAEAAIHGTPIENVHLHEVGALDSIIDVVGTVFALEALRLDRIVASPLNVGSGTIRSAHGLYPVPAPATLRLLAGAPVYAGPQRAELVTPTGALLITGYVTEFGVLPPMRVRGVGYGAGSRDLPETPNVVRVIIGESEDSARVSAVVVLEAEIDDMNPQIFGALMDRLLANGALDVFYTPIQMKKNRPGTLLTVLAAPGTEARMTGMIFRETTTIGVRYQTVARECLDRETLTVDTPFGPVRFKVARRNGERLNAAPEFDDCVRIAGEHQRPVKEIQALAMKAFLDSQP